MIAAVLYRAINRASTGAPLTTEQRLTLQWLRAEARVEREAVKRARRRRLLDDLRRALEGAE